MEFLGDEKQRDLCLKGPQELDELMRLLIDLKRRVCSPPANRERSSNFALMGVAALAFATSSTPGARVVAAAAAAQRRKIGFS